jgi:peptide/nickel transport system substrate-binding protein
MLQPNQTQPPFNNPAIRRAVMGAINQSDYMIAVAGEDQSLWRANCGFFAPGSPMATDVGMDVLNGPRDIDKVKRALLAAGYKGEKLVYLAPTDLPSLNAVSEVAADMFRKIGMNLDYVATDWGTVAQRFALTRAAGEGRLEHVSELRHSVSMISPAANNYIRGSGPKAMFGWPGSRRGSSGTALAVADSLTSRSSSASAEKCRRRPFQDVPHYPLGVFYPATLTARASPVCSMATRCFTM